MVYDILLPPPPPPLKTRLVPKPVHGETLGAMPLHLPRWTVALEDETIGPTLGTPDGLKTDAAGDRVSVKESEDEHENQVTRCVPEHQ